MATKREPLRRQIAEVNATHAEVTIRVQAQPGRTLVLELREGRLKTFEETDIVEVQTNWKSKKRRP